MVLPNNQKPKENIMRKSTGIILAAVGLFATPALAGNLTFDGGQTAWHSTQCTKPSPPPAVVAAHANTDGEDMNDLVSQYNAYVALAQDYMNCISNEADHDQTLVNQSITASAQKDIAQMQGEVDSLAPTPSH